MDGIECLIRRERHTCAAAFLRSLVESFRNARRLRERGGFVGRMGGELRVCFDAVFRRNPAKGIGRLRITGAVPKQCCCKEDESAYECAKREFYEECSINVDIALFENYFEQINIDKDIGIWLVDTNNIENLEKYFSNETLKENYLSWENSKVKFFSLDNLPKIKSKQLNLIQEIKDFLKSKHQFH